MPRKHLKGFSIEYANIKIKVNMKPTDKAIDRAQEKLDAAITHSMLPYMPLQNGTLIQRTVTENASLQGTGQIYAAVGPYGRFLYEGKVMVDPLTGSTWARQDAEKVVTDREIDFSKMAHPDAQKEWFLAAKRKDLKSWIDIAQKAIEEG